LLSSDSTPPTATPSSSAAAGAASDTDKDKEKDATPSPPNVEQMEFQAETRQLLDIVTNSLYTDKEVFLRELVSNASDSLEKLRHLQAANVGVGAASVTDPDTPLEIRIELDEVTSSITITDTGIGMTKEEMISNLGTIARSGSKNFVKELERMESGDAVNDPARGIIGKFGVGFYSAFMVGERVEVRSRSARADEEEQGPKVWLSEGTGTYQITDLQEGVRQQRGSSVVIHLKSDHWDFCDENRIEKILKRYSNFVQFPIFLNGNRVNTMEAVWAKDPKEVSDEEYSGFYKYIANAVDEPLDIMHFRAEVPLDVKALFYIPSFHSEKYGMGRMEPGVSLYSRKIMIETNSADILPDWLRFVKGVVDSEDLPLAISREKAQDSALIGKLRRALTRKFISHLTKMVKNDRSKYIDEFYREYSFFLKEGICQDYEFQAPLSKLLYFETSKNLSSDLISLDEYVSRMQPEQKDIFYLVAPTRDAALNSPYLEAFEKAGVDVLLLFTAIEDFVMANLEQYEGRKLVSVEKGDIDLSEITKDNKKDDDPDDKMYEADRHLTTMESVDFCEWFRKELGNEKVASCTATSRLTSFPAIVTDNESGAMRRMMRLVDTTDGNRDGIPLPKQHVEINPKHPVIVGIHDLTKTEPALAKVLAAQVFDNCLVAAGLLDDSRSMLPRLNDLLICVVNGAKGQQKPIEAPIEAAQVEEKKADDSDAIEKGKKD
jgi:TNF receptor-associated protein 1